jgi:RHS repeat-associated protein
LRKTTGNSGTVLYFHRNQQYSILALTDSSGNVSERYAYTAYGQPTFLNASATVQTSSAANNRYTYTAREWDATLGLHHFRARWMSGLTGRFLTRDPIGFKGSPFDLYEYCGSSPMRNTDPTGKTWWPWPGNGQVCNQMDRCVLVWSDTTGYVALRPGACTSRWSDDADYVWKDGKWYKVGPNLVHVSDATQVTIFTKCTWVKVDLPPETGWTPEDPGPTEQDKLDRCNRAWNAVSGGGGSPVF